MKQACPCCGGSHRVEIKAYWWMKAIPGSTLYQCNDCLESYLSMNGRSKAGAA